MYRIILVYSLKLIYQLRSFYLSRIDLRGLIRLIFPSMGGWSPTKNATTKNRKCNEIGPHGSKMGYYGIILHGFDPKKTCFWRQLTNDVKTITFVYFLIMFFFKIKKHVSNLSKHHSEPVQLSRSRFLIFCTFSKYPGQIQYTTSLV